MAVNGFSQAPPARDQRRIVLTTVGSLGDLHPYIALALGLRARGHDIIMATSECYRPKIEGLGLGFRAVRPDSDWVQDPEVMSRLMDLRLGTVRCVCEMLLPVLRQSYEDLLDATERADLLVSHPITYAARLVAEKSGIRWASTMITPLGFFSAYDLPVFPLAPVLSRRLRFLGHRLWGWVFRLGKLATRRLALPWYRLRAEIGLPATRELNPLADSFSPALVLALFSPLLAAKQADWPAQTAITGFPFFDQDCQSALPADLSAFLESGSPPLVFTLSCSAGTVAGTFFANSVAAARALGRRAVFITGTQSHNRMAELPREMIAVEYAPFAQLFPRAAVVVHAAGIGTTGLALRSGRPMLVVPYAHDQPDNAERLRRLGVARVVARGKYTPRRVARELQALLEEPGYARQALVLGQQVQKENGVRVACDALEEVLQRPHVEGRAAQVLTADDGTW